MKLGLFLPPGSARTAYAAGAVQVLIREGGLLFDVVAGNSIGALNAAFVATGQIDRLVQFWAGWRNRDIWGLDWRALWRGRLFWTAAFAQETRQKTTYLDPYLAEARLQPGVRYRINLGCMTTGDLVPFEWPGGPFPLADAVDASIAIPGAIRLYEALGRQWCDAGTVDSFAIEQLLLHTGVVRVFVVGVAPTQPDERPILSALALQLRAVEWWQYRETLDGLAAVAAVNRRIAAWEAGRQAAAAAIADLVSDPALQADLRAELAAAYAAAGFPYTRRAVEIIPILPERRTDMFFTDYQPRRSRALIAQGRRDARRVLRALAAQS